MASASLLFTVNDPAFFLSHRLPVARAAQEAGYEVSVAAPEEGLRDVEVQGFETHEIDLTRRSLDPVQEAKTRRDLERLYRQEKPDLVHHVTIKPVIHGTFAAKKARVPAVVNAVTGLGWAFIDQGLKARLTRPAIMRGYRHAFQHPNQVALFQNPDDRAFFTDRRLVDNATTEVILGSGIDPDQWPATPLPDTDEPLVVLPGRLLWDKGIGAFVVAAKRLKEQGIKARFALVGPEDPGNRAAVPRQTLDTWRDDGTVEIWGRRDDMQNVYAQAHIVCLPSRREGVPRALLEAMSMQRAIVTTDAPGCREAVRHEENGFLVPVDDAEALAVALRRLLEDPRLMTQYGTEGRRRALDRFTERHVADQTLALYRRLLH